MRTSYHLIVVGGGAAGRGALFAEAGRAVGRAVDQIAATETSDVLRRQGIARGQASGGWPAPVICSGPGASVFP